MCKLKKYHKTINTQIDKCMIELIKYLQKEYKILACCCGHSKYPATVIVKNTQGLIYELLTKGLPVIPRTRNFYKKDNQGYYYIPECRRWTKK